MSELTLKDLENRIDQLDALNTARFERTKTIIQKIGKQMTNDFDFDSLLEEIDAEETQEQNTVNQELDQLDSLLEDELIAPKDERLDEIESVLAEAEPMETPEEILSELDGMTSLTADPSTDTPVDNKETPEIPERELNLDTIAQEAADDEVRDLKQLLEQQKARIAELEAQTKTGVSSPETQELIEEFGDEIKSFAKEMLDVDMRKKALQEEVKAIKEDYKDRGVDIPWAMKAMKEIQKEMKETSAEAAAVQATKDFLREDESIVTTLDALNG